jgi:hypothetical protein
MQNLNQKNNELLITLNVEELTPTQVRLIKSVNSLMAHVLIAEEEGEYFEASAELLKKAAELIKHSSFAVDNKGMNYGDQSVEFAVDFLNESIAENPLRNMDN